MTGSTAIRDPSAHWHDGSRLKAGVGRDDGMSDYFFLSISANTSRAWRNASTPAGTPA